MTKSIKSQQSLSMWDYYITAITTKYTAFKGIATRKEYWSFVLFYTLFSLPFGILALLGIFFLVDLTWLNSIYKIVFFIPAVAIMIRRMHDVGWSAWLMLTIVAPFIAIFLPTNPNSKYAQEKSLPLTKGKKITIAVVLSLLSLGTIIDAFINIKADDSNKFSEVFTALCENIKDMNAQKTCLQELHTYEQALVEGKYKINCEDNERARNSYNTSLNEISSYNISEADQKRVFLHTILMTANDEKCDASLWINKYLPDVRKNLNFSASPKQKIALYREILNYQIKNNIQLSGKENFEIFNDTYSEDCPMYAPMIFYSLNPNAKFDGIFEKQGRTVYVFSLPDAPKGSKIIRIGYDDPSIMSGNEEDVIIPIYESSDFNDSQYSRSSEQTVELIKKDFCQPINKLLDKYHNLPVAEIVSKMRENIWGLDINKTETDNISQGLQELQDMSSDEMNDLVLQGMRQGYNQRCSATCLSRPNQQEMCRCICQVLAQTMSLQDFQYIMNYGEDEWVRQDRGKNILQNALNKCGN